MAVDKVTEAVKATVVVAEDMEKVEVEGEDVEATL